MFYVGLESFQGFLTITAYYGGFQVDLYLGSALAFQKLHFVL